MNVRRFLVFFGGWVLFLGCNLNNEPAAPQPVKDSSLAIAKEGKAITPLGDTPTNILDSIIHLHMSGLLETFEMNVRQDYQQIHVHLHNIHTKTLKATLLAQGKDRNIRFNQIEMPDGKTDGPFGQSLDYRTPKPGNYVLIIGRSNMADGIVKGPLTITVSLQ